jgi:hypothetical protein
VPRPVKVLVGAGGNKASAREEEGVGPGDIHGLPLEEGGLLMLALALARQQMVAGEVDGMDLHLRLEIGGFRCTPDDTVRLPPAQRFWRGWKIPQDSAVEH